MDVASLLRRAVQEYGDKIAVKDALRDRSRSYGDLLNTSQRLGRALSAAGLSPGDRVGILLGNSVEWVEASFSLALAGFTQFPLSPTEAADEVGARLTQVRARGVVTDSQTAQRYADALSPVVVLDIADVASAGVADPEAGDDVIDEPPAGVPGSNDFCIRFTSGSTGRPKGVVHTHSQYAAVISNQLHVRNWGTYFQDDDVFLHFLPVESALQFLYSSLVAGVTSVLLDPAEQAALPGVLEHSGVTMTFGAPPVLGRLVDEGPDRRLWLRTVFYGGATMPPALEALLRERFGDVFVHIYAASEFPGCTVTRRRGDQAAEDGSCGRAAFGVMVRVVGDDGLPCAPGQVGELEVHGDHVFDRYWDDAAATEEALDQSGWARLGDLATIDEQGMIQIVDRRHNLVAIGGRTIYPVSVERELSSTHANLEVVVDVVERDEVPTLVAVCHVGRVAVSERASVLQDVGLALDQFEVASEVVVVDEPLPKSAVGKILRKAVIGNL